MSHPQEPKPVPGTPVVISGEESRAPTPGVAAQGRWLHFPRRAVLLIAAFAVAIFLIRLIPTLLPAPRSGPLPPLLHPQALERLPASLTLLAASYAVALLLALVLALAGAAVSALASRTPRAAGAVSALGKVALYTWMPLPVLCTAFLLILAISGPTGGPALPITGDSFAVMLLGALLIAAYPALLAAQDAVRLGAGHATARASRRLLAAFMELAQALLLQMAGFLSALTVVELLFARPGIGQALLQGVMRLDVSLLTTVLMLMALLILLARLAAEALGAARRFALGDAMPIPSAKRPTRRLWPIFAALLLFIPLLFVLLGLLTAPEVAAAQNLQQRLAEPSWQHPLGSDALGRDIFARLRLGSLHTLGRASLIAGVLFLPALVLGALSGALWRRGGRLWESLSDIVLLPLDALLFLPVVPAATALALLAGPGGVTLLWGLALLLLPRAARAARDLWRERDDEGMLRHLLGMVAAIFLPALFHGFLALIYIDYMGLGAPPPAPTIGGLLQASQQHLLLTPISVVALVGLVSLLTFTLFTPAAAVGDIVASRRPLVHFNE